MMYAQSLPWCDPLALAAGVNEDYWVLLFSGAGHAVSGRYSILAHALSRRIGGNDWDTLAAVLSDDRPAFDNSWFGYLGYGLKNQLETLSVDAPYQISMADIGMMQFDVIYQFDHAEKKLIRWSRAKDAALLNPQKSPETKPQISKLTSNMRSSEYLKKAALCIEHIKAGDLYQVNLTRKFNGIFKAPPHGFALFCRLCEASPADYSAYIKMGDTQILSSSPELFLEIQKNGAIRSQPIKGSAPRGNDPAKDRQQRETLAASAKNRAENLMIVDLVRNDLAKSCVAGSIHVSSLFNITTHTTIHHMASTVSGQKREACGTLEAVKTCFPPGSMTGAPKIRAMELCSELERHRRGIYSGALGWFGGDGSAALSVVIRTLLLQGQQFEFQVGGGIVADSTPLGELAELLDKSRGICAALGLDRSRLEAL